MASEYITDENVSKVTSLHLYVPAYVYSVCLSVCLSDRVCLLVCVGCVVVRLRR